MMCEDRLHCQAQQPQHRRRPPLVRAYSMPNASATPTAPAALAGPSSLSRAPGPKGRPVVALRRSPRILGSDTRRPPPPPSESVASLSDIQAHSSLPVLLSHLSLSRPFNPITLLEPFSFSPPAVAVAASASPLLPSSFSHSSSTTKRASNGPHPHLTSKLKKLKIRHGHFRSALLLSGPSTLPSPIASTSSSSQTFPHASRPGLRRHETTPPSWWPSVSQPATSSLRPRADDEAVWVDTTQLQDLWIAVPSPPLSPASSPFPDPEALIPKGGGRSRVRAASSPPTFLAPPNHYFPYPTTAFDEELEATSGPALKKQLLAVLRMRLAEGGATSKGAEAGLRFKKWIHWNSWTRRTQYIISPLTAGSSGAGDNDDALVVSLSPALANDEAIPVILEEEDDLGLESGDVKAEAEADSSSSTQQDDDDSWSFDNLVLIPPLAPSPTGALEDPIAVPVQVVEEGGGAGESERVALLGPPVVVVRPRMRRANSLPEKALGLLSTAA